MTQLSREQLYFSYIMGELVFSTSLNDFLDYFGEDNIKELLAIYNEPLAKKNIKTNEELLKVIRIDFEKMIYALLEIKNKKAFQVISDIFNEDKNKIIEIITGLEGKGIYHLGFEVNQPMDLILYSFNYWINKFNLYFNSAGNEIKIVKLFRFPASQAFQKRVNAYVEIMRIWIEIDKHEEMLELFDIYHPVAITMNGKKSMDRPNINRLLAGDNIWHYAIYVDNPDKVKKLHSYFKILSVQNTIYGLPFQEIVNNTHDGSLYTKIINKEKKMELEFVTELVRHHNVDFT
ncbi:MAG: hypothetical protein HQK79_13265 [Desulfobacterales bacterium]|nr:hypothetical protein [Desulfobacterales bacterium]